MTHACLHRPELLNFFMAVSCKIFEHFATLPDPITEFKELGSALHRQGTILVPKQADLLSLLRKRLYPFYLRENIFSNPDPATMIWINSIFLLYKHVI